MLQITVDLKSEVVFETTFPETENPMVQNQFCCLSFTCCLKSILQVNPNHKYSGSPFTETEGTICIHGHLC